MKLSVFERLFLLQKIPPQEGFYTCIKIVRQFREDLSFNEEENKKLNFINTSDGKVRWEIDIVDKKEIKMGEIIKNIIQKILFELEKAEKLPENMIDLYEEFCVEKKEVDNA